MRNISILIVFCMAVFLLTDCNKNEDQSDSIKIIKTIPGGCAVNNGDFYKSISASSDTVTYSFISGNLDVFVGFGETCCGEYSTASSIRNDSVFINIKTVKHGMCRCECYYTYNFLFSGINQSHAVIIKRDDVLFYRGIIKP